MCKCATKTNKDFHRCCENKDLHYSHSTFLFCALYFYLFFPKSTFLCLTLLNTKHCVRILAWHLCVLILFFFFPCTTSICFLIRDVLFITHISNLKYFRERDWLTGLTSVSLDQCCSVTTLHFKKNKN